jgi:signal peptide peptidase SppA
MKTRIDDWLGAWAITPEVAQALQRYAETVALTPDEPDAVPGEADYAVEAGVARLSIDGPMMKYASSFGGTATVPLRRQLRHAAANPAVAVVLLSIDSPGGTVSGTQELADELAALNRRKPVLAHADDLVASAAYWVAAQARTLTATPMALVGSLGVISVVYDTSAKAAKEGWSAQVFTTGPLKGTGVDGTALTAAQQAYLQRRVDDAGAFFQQAVIAGRGDRLSGTLASVWTGEVWQATQAAGRSGPSALGLGLIDGVETYDDSLERAKRMAARAGLPRL